LQIIVTCHGPAESCSWLDRGVCHIVWPQEETDTRLIAYIREHEMGHCNGWPSHHPNARHIEYDPDAKTVPKARRQTAIPRTTAISSWNSTEHLFAFDPRSRELILHEPVLHDPHIEVGPQLGKFGDSRTRHQQPSRRFEGGH